MMLTEHLSSNSKENAIDGSFFGSLCVERVQRCLLPLKVRMLSMRSLVGRLDPPSASTRWKIQFSNPVVFKLRASPGFWLAAKTMTKIRRGGMLTEFKKTKNSSAKKK
jgi:hypothetical protein